MKFGYKKKTNLRFPEAVEKVKSAINNENLGVITEIDVRETFQKKLGIDFGGYVILGVCHPETAHRVLEIDMDMGLMLPCNIIIYKEDSGVYVSAILPATIAGVINNPEVALIAREVEVKLKKIVDSI
jgi:uncharacterized protein (DUF302 family)